jgi:hypothetical protein
MQELMIKKSLLHRIRLRLPSNKRVLVPLLDSDGARSRTLVQRPGTVSWKEPDIFGQSRQLASFSIQQPELRLSEWIEASPLAGSDFIMPRDERVAYHPAEFVASRDMPMVERYGVIRITQNSMFQYHIEPPVRMSAAVSLLGQCSGNYAHFITEVLPRLTVVDKFSEYRKLPLLVDGWMPHESHFSLIRMFGKYKRDIIRVGMMQCADVHRLITISPTAYASPESRSWIERRELSPLGPTDYKFNVAALNNVRELALRRKSGHYGKRLFLWRNPPRYGNARNVLELGKAARSARRAGFHVIDPANMKIEEQIKAFRGGRTLWRRTCELSVYSSWLQCRLLGCFFRGSRVLLFFESNAGPWPLHSLRRRTSRTERICKPHASFLFHRPQSVQ